MELKRIGAFVRDSWLVLGSTVLLLTLLELGLALLFACTDAWNRTGGPYRDPRLSADALTDSAAARAYFEEFRDSDTSRWTPYTYWRRAPYRGRLINIDSTGLRRSIGRAAASPRGTPVKIFMFGGSTLWGTGTPDASTIPSLLLQQLQAQGIAAEVTNFGESGYVTTQEVIVLMQELQRGRTPHLVIFYDGVNDTFSAFQQRRAGLPQNEFNREVEFNLSQPGAAAQRRALVLRDVVRGLATYRALRTVQASVTKGVSPTEQSSSQAAATATLIGQMLAVYRGNMDVVRALGAQYQFQSLSYWQPSIFQKPHLTPYEATQQAIMTDFGAFTREANAAVARAEFADRPAHEFHDLGDTFRDTTAPIFLDFCHVAEMGNAMIAQRIGADVVRLLATRPRP